MITFKQFNDHCDLLQKIGNNRKAYVILCHASAIQYLHLNIRTIALSVMQDTVSSILARKEPCVAVTFESMSELNDSVLTLANEVIMTNEDISSFSIDNQEQLLRNSLSIRHTYSGYSVFVPKTLDVMQFRALQVNDSNAEFFNSLSDTVPWQPYHVAHVYPEQKVILQVIWDRREIVNVINVDEDTLLTVDNFVVANDNIRMYYIHECIAKDLPTELSEFVVDTIQTEQA